MRALHQRMSNLEPTNQVSLNCPKCSRRTRGIRLADGKIKIDFHAMERRGCSRSPYKNRPCLFSGDILDLSYLNPELTELIEYVLIPSTCTNDNCDSKGSTVLVAKSDPVERWHLCMRKLDMSKPVPLGRFWDSSLPQDEDAFKVQPMQPPSAAIFYLDSKYGESK